MAVIIQALAGARRAAVLVAFVLGGTVPAGATPRDGELDARGSAPRESPRFDDRPFAVLGVLGFGSLVGLLGVEGQYTVAEAVALGGGAGVNVAGGLQLAGFVNFRPLVWSDSRSVHALSVVGGYSTGSYEAYDLADFTFMSAMSHSSEPERRYALDRAHWVQFDIGFERQFGGGVSIRSAIGAAFLLNPGSAYCRTSSRPEEALPCEGTIRGTEPSAPLGTLTLTLGYAL